MNKYAGNTERCEVCNSVTHGHDVEAKYCCHCGAKLTGNYVSVPAIKPRPMSEAPLDGTRVLLQTKTFAFKNYHEWYVPSGDTWLEALFVDGQWQVWCGNAKTQTTMPLEPLAWCERPGSPLGGDDSNELWEEK